MRHRIGYTTGTFDFIHEGHLQLLQRLKVRCRYLIVGIVTDELCLRQKRRPVMPYSQRKAILEHCQHVDQVVAHSGETKAEAYAKLKFDILFIGDDYFGADEYTMFAKNHPRVPVLYIPRTRGVSTSTGFADLQARVVLEDQTILRIGLDGPVLRFGVTVIKPIRVGVTEYVDRPTLCSTTDQYGIGLPEPRNWRGVAAATEYPMIPSINPYREMLIIQVLKQYRWFCGSEYLRKYVHDNPINRTIGGNRKQRIQQLLRERRNPRAVYWLVQRYAGEPLRTWLTRPGNTLDRLMPQIKEITDDLRSEAVVHGDIHQDNLCVDQDDRVSLIDFGWCSWRGFALTTGERELLEQRLTESFDMMHFRRTMKIVGKKRSDE